MPRPFAFVPTVHSRQWEGYATFRETLLAKLRDPVDNQAFRAFGRTLHDLVLEGGRRWPYNSIDATAHYLQAASG